MTIFKQCDELLQSGAAVAMATVINAEQGTPGKPGFKLLLSSDGGLYGTVGGGALENRVIEEARKVLKTGNNLVIHYDLADLNMKCGGNVDVVIEYIQGIKHILLFGGGHIARALSPILELLGFKITVVDPRPDVQTHFDALKTTTVTALDYNDLSSLSDAVRSAEWCFVATHGHVHDYAVLKQLLGSGAEFRYLGMVGSYRKIDTTKRMLEEDGLSVPNSFYAPVGIKIGGQSASEIAVSVAAEIVAVLNGVASDHMRRLKT